MKEQKLQAYKEMMSAYWDWFQEQRGFKPRIDASDGKALKQIVDYLFTLNEDMAGAVDTFKFILKNWNGLSDFYKKGIRLRQINSNIVNILDTFKNGKHSENRSGVSTDYLTRVAREMQDTDGNHS